LLRAQLQQERRVELLFILYRFRQSVATMRADDQLVLAKYRLEAEDNQPEDADLFTMASKLARPDYVLAERFARAAHELDASFTALDYLVDALLWQGRADEALELADSLGSDGTLAEREYFSARIGRMRWWMKGERPTGGDATTVDRDVSADLETATSAELAAVARKLGMLASSGQAPGVEQAAQAILAHPASDDEARCWASGAAMLVMGGRGRTLAAQSIAGQALRWARKLADFNYLLQLSVIDIWLRRHSGDLIGADRAVAELRRSSETADNPNPGVVALFEADLVLAHGRAGEAIPLLRDSAIRLDDVDFGGLSSLAHARLGEALMLTGMHSAAIRHMEESAVRATRLLEIFQPELQQANAWVLDGKGDHTQAAKLLNEATRQAADQGQTLIGVGIQHQLLRSGDRSSTRRLISLAKDVDGRFAEIAANHAKATMSSNVTAMAEAGEAFGRLGTMIQAADTIAQAATLAIQQGDLGAGRRLVTRAREIAAGCGGIDTPRLRAVSPNRPPLTRRQEDVARLAASGFSNRAIAEHLAVSIRTVESHLDAIYRRLAVSSRADLSTYFPEVHLLTEDQAAMALGNAAL
jgi:DNA-binding NarL/FixJ family response regulator